MKSTPSSQKKKEVTSKGKGRDIISDVWNHFTIDESVPNNFRAICNYCDKDYAGVLKDMEPVPLIFI